MLETVFLTILTSTLPLTAILGKAFFPLWIWLIYFTFPGTYATQPAVTTQTFGHKYGGTIYGFLFTSDIINNLLVGVLSKAVLDAGGWVGFFLVLACFRYYNNLVRAAINVWIVSIRLSQIKHTMLI